MVEPHLGELKPFFTIGKEEKFNVFQAMGMPLSGYMGGNPKAGYWVERLSAEWAGTFGVKYAAPCNSATSGLLAACMAIGIQPGDVVWTTPYSMSATAACAKVLGATVRFVDIERERFGIDPAGWPSGSLPMPMPKAIIVTNLFGHPAYLMKHKAWCDEHNVYLIEDNAQAPFATEDGKYAGTIGHIGVWSLNCHKQIQAGEGGVIATNDTTLALRLQGCINHGELDPKCPWTGLNLRMTETTAAIACAQLAKAKGIIEGRREIGLALCDMVKDVPWITPHVDQPGCKHVYYLWTALTKTKEQAQKLAAGVQLFGFPLRWRYAPLLHHLFNTNDVCPVVEEVDQQIIVYEVCAFDLSAQQLTILREIIKRVAGVMHEDRAA